MSVFQFVELVVCLCFLPLAAIAAAWPTGKR